MKKRNRFLALVLAGALALSMTACGNGGADSETSGDTGVETEEGAASEEAEAPAEEEADPFAAAQENMKTVTSLDAVMEMEMDMVVNANGEEQSVESVTTTDMSCFYDPLHMRMDMTVDAGGVNQTANIYIENSDEGCMMYMNDGTGWQSQEISVTDVDQYDFSTDMSLYLDGNYNFEEAGTEDVNGSTAYKYTGTISGDEMKDLILSSGALDSVKQLGVDESQLDSLMGELGDLKIDYWIDQATMYPVKYEIDMTETMDTLMSSLLGSLGEQAEGLSMNVPKMVIRMTCSNYNAATDFSIPEEAKAAQ